ncbi:alpha/beta fold hydrolase [Marivibrio halodurans]|uniref:Alpha/beta fold hydrolase n=1 Tax=Marivibrio halodurans TaxID=2039722 RepID=A0A8J7S193_9PROT|nr:alpha/beta fold hydrolase [Marivibrio halodurans]MBP5856844.1 alpha/beta fold hydrolase [Marivibrio halodurans]
MLNCHSIGGGVPLVLLHAIGLDHESWRDVQEALAPGHRVIAVDQRGHGGSPGVVGEPSLADYADDTARLIESLDLGPVIVVGLSFGGMIAQHLTIRRPDLVSRLVLCGCPGRFPDDIRPALAARGEDARRGGMGGVVEPTLERWFTPEFLASGGAERVRRRLLSDDVSGWAAGWRAISNHDAQEALMGVGCETLCVAGALDKATPPAMVRALADAIPRARYAEIPGAPHIMHLERHDAFVRVIGDFVDKG